MKIQVDYEKKTFGNDYDNASKYTLTVSRGYFSDIRINFRFERPTDGMSGSDSYAGVKGGEIFIPKPQAASLASAILWWCEQSTRQPQTEPIVLILDETQGS